MDFFKLGDTFINLKNVISIKPLDDRIELCFDKGNYMYVYKKDHPEAYNQLVKYCNSIPDLS